MIGIFDSGLGGLTVVRAIQSVLPEYDILYLGDTARLPYGNRSHDLVYEFTREGVDFLLSYGCELIILACNTASSEALRKIQQEHLSKRYEGKRVLGVIRPLAEQAARLTKNNRIGVIGTRGTVHSQAYVRELEAQNPDMQVFQNPAPLLVPLIEEGWGTHPASRRILKSYLRPLKEKRIDTLILGCTHYEMIYGALKSIAGRSVNVLESGKIVAESLKDYLQRHPEIEKKLSKNKKYQYCVTDITDGFRNNASRWMGGNIELEKVDIQ